MAFPSLFIWLGFFLSKDGKPMITGWAFLVAGWVGIIGLTPVALYGCH
jgi:hypothetical protein